MAASSATSSAPPARTGRSSSVRRRTRSESGVVAIEFALTLPLIFIVIFSIIEFGQVFNNLNDLNQIAANGARYAAVDQNPGADDGDSLNEFLATQAGTQRLKDDIKVCVEFPESTQSVGDPVKVVTSSTYTLLPIIGTFVSNPSLSLEGSATMRIERPPTTYAAGC